MTFRWCVQKKLHACISSSQLNEYLCNMCVVHYEIAVVTGFITQIDELVARVIPIHRHLL